MKKKGWGLRLETRLWEGGEFRNEGPFKGRHGNIDIGKVGEIFIGL